ncbi:MAG TPA: DNA polymerase III subunit delta [Candidatus Dormibacteraeota bacterium]|nr:DNA polymerase III subunit delta [Candidatus Dormibacteraeota bacterium]
MPRASSGAATVLLLHGEERFLVEEKARAVIAGWREGLVSDFGYEPLDGGALPAARLQDAILQGPFLDPFRVVWARGVPGAKAESLAPALSEVPATTRLLITINGRVSSTNKLAKAVTGAGGKVEESQRLRGRALTDWTVRRAEELGLTRAVGAQAARVSHADVGVIDSELQKLVAYKASGAKLTPDVVNELLAGAREDEVFKLTDNLLPSPTAQAWTVARNLTRSGYQPTSVAYRIARHLALVLEVRARQDRGESLHDMQNDMTEHSFVVQKAYDSARSVQPERLEAALRAIRDYEWEVKSGQVDAELGLEVLLSRL